MWDPLQPEKTLNQIRKYCAFQDRSVKDTEAKLKSLKVPSAKIAEFLGTLKAEKFLDDARFVTSFVRGKFRQNHWGRIKIAYALRAQGIPDGLIREGLEQLDEEEYHALLLQLISRKEKEIKEPKNLNHRQKIINFAMGRGFETELILDCLKELKL
jgi:regulatory protein